MFLPSDLTPSAAITHKNEFNYCSSRPVLASLLWKTPRTVPGKKFKSMSLSCARVLSLFFIFTIGGAVCS